MAGKTRSSLPTDQRRRNTTIPGMASGSEEDHQAQYSPSATEPKTNKTKLLPANNRRGATFTGISLAFS